MYLIEWAVSADKRNAYLGAEFDAYGRISSQSKCFEC